MSLPTAPRRRALVRSLAVGAVVASAGLLGAPAASAAEDARPVIALDPQDVGLFLVPEAEEGEIAGLGEDGVPADEDALAVAALAEAAAVLPPEATSALGGRSGIAAEEPAEEGTVGVAYGGTVHLQLPDAVDSSAATFVLDVDPPAAQDLPRRYKTDPTPSDQPLTVNRLGGGAFDVTAPPQFAPYGPTATLTVDRLTSADTGADLLLPLEYELELTASGAPEVDLRPLVAVLSHATCSLESTFTEDCPGPAVGAGEPVDLVVPPDSLLVTLGFAQLDTAFYSLEAMDDEEPYLSYDSETNPELVTAHGPSSATLHVPADARPGPYLGFVVQGDPATGFAATYFSLDVPEAAAAPEPAVNPGLHSDTGWVDEVREASPGSTAAVAGGALLLVGGLVTVAALRPGRRPPLGG